LVAIVLRLVVDTIGISERYGESMSTTIRFASKAIAASAVVLLLSSLPASAVTPGPIKVPAARDEIAQVVTAAVDPLLKEQDVAATSSAGGSFQAINESTVSIPGSGSGIITATKSLESGVYSIGVGLASGLQVPGGLATDGSVVFDGVSGVDSTVQATSDGFRIHTVIGSSTAPAEYVHPVTLPAGASLVLAKDAVVPVEAPGDSDPALETGAYVLDSTGSLIGGFGSPWAKDANGMNIATHFELRGSSLVQVVDHQVAGVAYPVVADPYLGFAMIRSASWVSHPEGWTLQVTPTAWSRGLAGAYYAGYYGWIELYAKYRYAGLNTNLDGMRDQYICHQQVVAIRSPRKATWNLDEWRPNVSYAQTVNASCNPGGAKWFD
jgi:hypothetical protein